MWLLIQRGMNVHCVALIHSMSVYVCVFIYCVCFPDCLYRRATSCNANWRTNAATNPSQLLSSLQCHPDFRDVLNYSTKLQTFAHSLLQQKKILHFVQTENTYERNKVYVKLYYIGKSLSEMVSAHSGASHMCEYYLWILCARSNNKKSLWIFREKRRRESGKCKDFSLLSARRWVFSLLKIPTVHPEKDLTGRLSYTKGVSEWPHSIIGFFYLHLRLKIKDDTATIVVKWKVGWCDVKWNHIHDNHT